jgi:hypothetical protein
MKTLEFEKTSLMPLSPVEMEGINGGLILINLNIFRATKELVEFAIGEVVDFGTGVYDGFTHFVK